MSTRSPATSDPFQGLVTAFLTPPAAARDKSLYRFEGATRHTLTTSQGDIAWVEVGAGPTVLLVHGWAGHASDLLAVGLLLQGQGFRVVAFDLPAHGESGGDQTHLPACALAVLELAAALGPMHAVVAHSVGAAAAVEAVRLGMQVQSLVLIGAPARYRDYVNTFGRMAGLDAHATGAFKRVLEQAGIAVDALDVPAIAVGLSQRALFIHADDDRVVPLADAQQSAAAWPHARMLILPGLGHRRILTAPATLQAVSETLAWRAGSRIDLSNVTE